MERRCWSPPDCKGSTGSCRGWSGTKTIHPGDAQHCKEITWSKYQKTSCSSSEKRNAPSGTIFPALTALSPASMFMPSTLSKLDWCGDMRRRGGCGFQPLNHRDDSSAGEPTSIMISCETSSKGHFAKWRIWPWRTPLSSRLVCVGSISLLPWRNVVQWWNREVPILY